MNKVVKTVVKSNFYNSSTHGLLATTPLRARLFLIPSQSGGGGGGDDHES